MSADPFSVTNGLVQRYRQFLQTQGKVDPRSDLELTVELGNLLRAQGEDAYDEKTENFPDFREQYLTATQATDRSLPGEVIAGAKRGVAGLGATALGLGALGAKTVGADETAASLANKARALETPDVDTAPTVGRMKDVQDVGGGSRYVLGKVGEIAPNIAEALLTSLAGSAIGSAVEPGGGTVAGGMGGLIAKNAIKQMVRKNVAEKILGEELGEAGIEAALRASGNEALRTAFASEAKNVAARMGGEAAAYLNAAALGAGGTFNATGDVGASVGAGLIGGAAGALLPGSIVRRFYPAESAAGSFMARLGRDLPKELAIGTGGTMGQELANLAAEKMARGEPATLTAKDIERLKEAAVGGALGGAIAAPIGAAANNDARPSVATNVDDAAIDARRRAMTAPPSAPDLGQPKTRGELLRDALALSPADQDARIDVLAGLSKRTPLEDQELELLRALALQRPTGIARTASAPVAEQVADSAPTPSAMPVATDIEPTLLVANPASTEPVAEKPAAAPTNRELAQQLQIAGNKLARIVTSVPSLDVSEATQQLDAINKTGAASAADVAQLAATVAALEQKAVVQAARLATEKITARQAAIDAKAKAKAEKLAAKAKAQAEAAALAMEGETRAAIPEPPTPEPVPSPDASTSQEPASDSLKTNLDRALNPAFEAGPIAQDGIINFQQLAEGLAQRGVGQMSDEAKAKLRAFDFNGWLKQLFAEKTANGRPGLFFDVSGNKSQTRLAVAFLLPDGRVIQAGVLPDKNVQRIGSGEGKVRGNAVQRMGTETRTYNSDRSAATYTKAIEPGGKKPALFDDLVKNGAVPFDAVLFDRPPGEIFQEFANREAYEAALARTERKQKSVATDDRGAMAGGANLDPAELAEQTNAALAAQTATPEPDAQQRLADVFGEAPELFGKIAQRAAEHGPDAAYAKLPKIGREQIDALLTEARATPADLTGYLRGKVEANASLEPTQTTVLPSPALATTDVPSPAFQKFAAALTKKPKFSAKLYKLIGTQGDGNFEKAFARMGDENRDAITDIATKAGIAWPEFSSRLQKAYDTSAGTPASFVDRLNGIRLREPGPSRASIDRTAQFNALLGRLEQSGFDIKLIPGRDGAGKVIGGTVVLPIQDLANANLENVVALIHEVGHVEVDRLDPRMRESLSQAVARTIETVSDGALIKAADNANQNWEEKLVETLAIKLGEEGIAQTSLAATIWRTVKDAYLRAGLALMRAFGLEPNARHVVAWFENNLRRRLGGDYDYRFVDLFRPFVERSPERVSRFAIIDGQEIADLLNPLTGKLQHAEVLPDTTDAAQWNLDRQGDVRFREPAKPEEDMPYTEAMARVQGAAWAELIPTIAQAKAEFGSALTDAQFWKLVARGDLPADIVKQLETRVPGSATATIGGEKMTDPMNQRARYQAFRLANVLATVSRRRAAADEERLARYTDEIVARAKTLNKVERVSRDAAEMNVVFSDALTGLVKELAADLDRGPDTGFAAGKLLGAIRAVERLAPDQAIPEEYQRVFAKILDANGTSAFDYLSAVARLELPLARMSVPDIIAAIRANAAGDKRLKLLSEQRPLMIALATLARNATRELDLLRLNAMRDTAEYIAIKAELDEIRRASDARLEEIAQGIPAFAEHTSLRDRLRRDYLEARREFAAAKRAIQRAQENQFKRTRFAEIMAVKAAELSRNVGAFSYWEARDGATYHAMQLNEGGEWSATNRTLRMIDDDISEQHERVAHDLVMNRRYLEANRELAGSRLYEEVRRQTEELSKLDFAKNYEAAHRFWFDRFLQPLGQKFASTGQIAGTKIKQMLSHWQSVMFVHGDEVDATARRWNKALQEAADAAGYTNPRRFFDEVMGDVIYHVESEPGRDRTGALREARRAARRRLGGRDVAEDFSEKLDGLLDLHKEMSELLLRVAENNGVYVADPRVRDPLTNKGNLQRHAIKYGYLTASRRLRSEVVRTLVHDMQGRGWTDTLFADLDPDTTNFSELAQKYFPPTVVREFVEPFVMKPGKEVFFGADDANGRATPLSQVEAQEIWHEAGGDLLGFIDRMFDRTNRSDNRDGLNDYRAAIFNRFADLYRMESRLAARADQTKSALQSDTKSHALMDSRTNDLIPPEHFGYEVYSPMDARRKLTEIAFHAAFGRDGNGLDAALSDLKHSLAQAADRYQLLPKDSTAARKAAAEAKGWNYKLLKRATDDLRNVSSWERKLWHHFTGKEAVLGDAKWLLELAQLNTSLVLNQPKSGLWNLMSLLEYPLIYRGLGRTSIRATGTAAKVFGREAASSFLQAFGLNFLRATDYAHEISAVIEKRQSERLPFGILLSDMGPNGQFAEGGAANRVTQISRGIQTALRKGVGPGGFNALWAPFHFIGAKADTAIAAANVQAFEMMVQRGLEYFSKNPEARDNPGFRFTAEDLGLKNGAWFNDEGAFRYFRERAVEYRLGNFEEIVRDAGRRTDGQGLLTRDQALGLAMMALNEVSLQASVNTRPVEFLDNPVLRLGGLMLGWPLAKMNQVHDAFKTPEGKLTLASALRTVGVMAAWSLPAGLAYSLLMDQYDEKMLAKKSNLRGIDPIALTPLIGPAVAATDGDRGMGNLAGILDRLARAGTYGLMGDVLNGAVNSIDPRNGQRSADLNSRVLVYAQLANFFDVLRNLIQQEGAYTYQSVGRPFVTALGGSGVIQATQIVNHALGLSNAEAAVTNRINVNNVLRAAGREAGVEVRAAGGAASPTPLSVWVQEMKTTALSNDRLGFLDAYRHAIDVARTQGEADPENKVLEAFKSRSPLESVFARKPSDTDMAKLYAAMDEDGKRAVLDATTLFENYVEMIAPSFRQAPKPSVTAVELRRRLANRAHGL